MALIKNSPAAMQERHFSDYVNSKALTRLGDLKVDEHLFAQDRKQTASAS